MAIAWILIAASAAYAVYRSNIVGLVLSLPGSNEDFVFTGREGGRVAESTNSWAIPPEDQVPCADSPRPAT